MSLLMEALRKAEEAKRRIQTEDTASRSGFGTRPAVQRDIAPAPVLSADPQVGLAADAIDTTANTDHIDDNFRPSATNAGAPSNAASALQAARRKPGRASVEELQSYLETTPESEDQLHTPRAGASGQSIPDPRQRAAGAVFKAKQKPARSNATRNVLLIALFIIPAGAAALWYLAYLGNSSLLVDPALLARDAPTRSLSDELFVPQTPIQQNAPLPVQEPVSTPQSQSEAPDTVPIPVAEEPAVAATTNPPAQSAQAAALPAASSAAAPEQTATDAGLASVPDPAAEIAPDSPAPGEASQVLEISHSAGSVKTNQHLLDAYASLQAGDVDAAAVQYQRVLELLPNNRDALLGNAAIAMRAGDLLRARDFYSRLMQLNPKDPLARTGLLQTVEGIDQTQHEQELQRLIQQYPGVAPLSFAIGNLYAAQRRWNEAQSAYFDAFLFAKQANAGAISPDYAYNLAVSLEQLNQPTAALDYYRQAQTLANEVRPQFDMQQLNRRISFLEQNTQ